MMLNLKLLAMAAACAQAFLAPLEHAEAVIRVGIFSREPLEKWVGDAIPLMSPPLCTHEPSPMY